MKRTNAFLRQNNKNLERKIKKKKSGKTDLRDKNQGPWEKVMKN